MPNIEQKEENDRTEISTLPLKLPFFSLSLINEPPLFFALTPPCKIVFGMSAVARPRRESERPMESRRLLISGL